MNIKNSQGHKVNNSRAYIEDALRTESIDGAAQRLTNKPVLIHGLKTFTEMAEDQVDNIKKYIYYGKKSHTIEAAPNRGQQQLVNVSEENLRLLHAGLGFLTEAAEFLLPVIESIRLGIPVDKVNLKEELGDLQWYQAIGCDVLETTFEEEQARNIAKLKLRYPDKFTEDKAINRDIEAERKILEQGSSITIVGYDVVANYDYTLILTLSNGSTKQYEGVRTVPEDMKKFIGYTIADFESITGVK